MGPPPWSERSGRWAAGSPVSARICRSYSDSISVLACCSPPACFIGIRFPRIRRLFRVLWNCPGSSKAGCTGDAPLGAVLADPPLRYTPAAGCLPYGNIPFYFTHIAPPSRQDQTGYIIIRILEEKQYTLPFISKKSVWSYLRTSIHPSTAGRIRDFCPLEHAPADTQKKREYIVQNALPMKFYRSQLSLLFFLFCFCCACRCCF